MNDDQKQRLRELFAEETIELARAYMRKILSTEEFENWQLSLTNNKGCWSPTEIDAFVRGFEHHGKNRKKWVKIAAVVTTRTAQQCKDYSKKYVN